MTTPKSNPVNWFEIPTTNLTRAQTFYEKVFDIKLSPSEMGPIKMAFFPMERDVPGAGGALVDGPGYEPSHKGTMVYFSVQEINASLEKIKTAGGKVLQPKMSIGQYGSIAHFEDSEGNRVSLHQMT